jgi:hypothetical protein
MRTTPPGDLPLSSHPRRMLEFIGKKQFPSRRRKCFISGMPTGCACEPKVAAPGPAPRRGRLGESARSVESLHVERIDCTRFYGVNRGLRVERDKRTENDFSGQKLRDKIVGQWLAWADCGFRIFAHILRKGLTYIKVSRWGSRCAAPARRQRRPA